MFKRLPLLFFAVMLMHFFSCSNGEEPKEQPEQTIVRLRESADASTLNPLNIRSSLDGYLSLKLFQSLLSFDYKTLETVPILAEKLPEINYLESGKVEVHYKIRQNAKWDNGKPITADDIAFTLKIIKNPYSSNIGAYSFYELIEDIEYETGSREFSIIFSKQYILNEITSGDFAVLPSFVYDTNNYLQEFTVKQLSSKNAGFSDSEIDKLKEFNENFNSMDFRSNKDFIKGSGPYQLQEWVSGQQIVLSRKKNWWGDEMDSVNTLFLNNADLLIYEIIKDNTTAMVALRNHQIDVMRDVSPTDIEEWAENKRLLEEFNIFSPDQIGYHYIGLNQTHSILKNIKIRKAIRMSINVDKIIKAVMGGYATKINGPVLDFFKYHNDTLETFEYLPKKAIEILKKEGWSDRDKNGILEKEINGKTTELSLDYLYYSDNDSRKYTALIIQEDLKKVGIHLNLIPLEWGNFLNRLKNQQFDLFYGSKILAPVPRDHKPAFHSESISKGSNYAGYSNKALDQLIDSSRSEMDTAVRRRLEWRFQEMIYEQIPYIYLFSPKERIIIADKFTNLNISPLRPGYWEPGFKLKK